MHRTSRVSRSIRPTCPRGTLCLFHTCEDVHPPAWCPSDLYPKGCLPCTFGLECFNANCDWIHPFSWDPNVAFPQCRSGAECSNIACERAHPAGWDPRKLSCPRGDMCDLLGCIARHSDFYARPQRASNGVCSVHGKVRGTRQLYEIMRGRYRCVPWSPCPMTHLCCIHKMSQPEQYLVEVRKGLWRCPADDPCGQVQKCVRGKACPERGRTCRYSH